MAVLWGILVLLLVPQDLNMLQFSQSRYRSSLPVWRISIGPMTARNDVMSSQI